MALQAVEPKCEVSVVLPEPHCGQATFDNEEGFIHCTRLCSLWDDLLCGGAMPYASNLALASVVIQSLDQAGDKHVITLACKPANSKH